MGYFFSEIKKKTTPRKELNENLATQYGCTVCPRNNLDIKSPKMEPYGAKKPIYYFLGESPGRDEDDAGRQFVGVSGKLLREPLASVVPQEAEDIYIRWNNTLRCYNKNETPTPFEISCCRASIVNDIEESKPLVVVGFGTTPLKAFMDGNKISLWRGRLIPAKFGSHVCWYYPVFHPAYVKRNRSYEYKNEIDDVFERDIKFLGDAFLDGYEKPEFIENGYTDNISSMNVLEGVIDGIRSFYGDGIIAVDIETTTLRPYEPDAAIWSIALSNYEKTIAFPLQYKGFYSQEQINTISKELELLFCNVGGVIAHNLKFEMEWFLHLFGNQAFMRVGTFHDTMAQAYVLDERTSKTEGMLNLGRLTKLHFGFDLKSKSNVDSKNMKSSSIEDILRYNGMDAKYTHKLFFKQEKILLDKSLKMCYTNLIETTKTLTLTQAYGLNVDMEKLTTLTASYQAQLEYIMSKIKLVKEVKDFEKNIGVNKSGEKFNPLSYDHAVKLFRDIYKVEEKKKTKGKQYSVDDEVLTILKDEGLVVASYILEYRSLTKLISTYLDSVAGYTFNDVVHPNFNLLFTSTGRLSSGESVEE